MILNATEAVYRCLLFLRGKNGEKVRNRGQFWKKSTQSWFQEEASTGEAKTQKRELWLHTTKQVQNARTI